LHNYHIRTYYSRCFEVHKVCSPLVCVAQDLEARRLLSYQRFACFPADFSQWLLRSQHPPWKCYSIVLYESFLLPSPRSTRPSTASRCSQLWPFWFAHPDYYIRTIFSYQFHCLLILGSKCCIPSLRCSSGEECFDCTRCTPTIQGEQLTSLIDSQRISANDLSHLSYQLMRIQRRIF
jgi:hypothetical protein